MKKLHSLHSFLLLLAFLVAPLAAQVDIESQRKDDHAGFYGSLAVGLTLQGGNVELFQSAPKLSLNWGRTDDTVLFIGAADLGWQGGERFSNEALAHLRYVRALGSQLYGEIYGQTNYDHSRRLDARRLAGAGLRLALIEGDALWLGSSLMWEHEEHDQADETSLARWSSYVSINLQLSESAQLAGTAYLQPAIKQFDDYRTLGDVTLTVSITEALSSTTALAFRRDSDPIPGIEDSDYSLTTGLALDW